VLETLQGFRARHPEGKLVAVFEPRSATASRRIHQDAYARAFASADEILLAPVGRSEIPEVERLDLVHLQRDLQAAGKSVHLGESIDALVQQVADIARPGDTIVAMSNGAFGQIHDKLLCTLACRARRAAE
jgi:UDP-N-acetylmuramate: L-alanyl-gamma-D-glutamyl-meso-diaminopimelate ligase